MQSLSKTRGPAFATTLLLIASVALIAPAIEAGVTQVGTKGHLLILS